MKKFIKSGPLSGGPGIIRSASALALVALLSGCGGGGGGSALSDTGADQLSSGSAEKPSLDYSGGQSEEPTLSFTDSDPSDPVDSDTNTAGGSEGTSDTSTVVESDGDTVVTKPAPNTGGEGTVELPPEFEQWEKDMVTSGKKWGEYISDSSSSDRLNAVYYDGEWIYYQIADYTGDAEPWTSYARAAEKVYRDGYLKSNDYTIPGYWRFPHGLYEDNARGSDTTLDEIASIRDNPSFSNPAWRDYSWKWYHARYSREIAYAIHANLTAEKAGLPRQESRMQAFIKMAENHLDQWRRGDYSNPSIGDTSHDRMKPFMFGLTAHALIDFYEWEKKNGRDPNAYFHDIPGRLAEFAKWMFNEAKNTNGKRMWVPDLGGTGGAWNDNGGTGYGAFRYVDSGTNSELEPAPDLNLLIAPAYAWLYRQTGDMAFRTMADDLFSGGVMLAATHWNGKIFDQNYRWSFKYVEWRKQGDRKWR